MNRNHLALFEAVVQHGGISAAAAKIHLSQPAISKQIGELEAYLGLQLLEREARGCRPTEAGTLLAGYASRIRSLESAAESAMVEYRDLRRGRLRLGASQTIGSYLLPRAVAQFKQRHPQIEVSLEIANTEAIEKALVDGTVELGFTEGRLEPAELESNVFDQDEIVAVAPAGHRLADGRPHALVEVLAEPLILRESGSGTRAVIEAALRKKRKKVTPLMELSSPEAIKHAVLAGIGLTLISRLTVAGEIAHGSLVIVPVRDWRLVRPLHYQVLRDRQATPAVTQFLAVIRDLSRSKAD